MDISPALVPHFLPLEDCTSPREAGLSRLYFSPALLRPHLFLPHHHHRHRDCRTVVASWPACLSPVLLVCPPVWCPSWWQGALSKYVFHQAVPCLQPCSWAGSLQGRRQTPQPRVWAARALIFTCRQSCSPSCVHLWPSKQHTLLWSKALILSNYWHPLILLAAASVHPLQRTCLLTSATVPIARSLLFPPEPHPPSVMAFLTSVMTQIMHFLVFSLLLIVW